MKKTETVESQGTTAQNAREKPGSRQRKSQEKTRQSKTKNEGSGKCAGKDLRQALFLNALKGQRLFNISAACESAGVSRARFYDWRDNDVEFQASYEEVIERRKDEFEQDLQKQSRAGDSRSTTFFLERQARDRGYGKEIENKKLAAILQQAMSGEITPLEAAYKVNMMGLPLPEVLKLQLSKPEPPTPPDERPPLTNEELEKRYQESISKAESEKTDWLPGRQEEVRKIKEEEKGREQFGPGEDEA